MRKVKNYLVLFIVITTIISCSSYKYLYGYATDDSYKRVSKSLEYVMKKDELFLVFTKNYNNTKVKVVQNNTR